jgi:two-component system cell cycle sensor histidine kinase/response regulator CckA
MYVDLVLNLTLLVALSVVSGFVAQRWPAHSRPGALAQGALFGGTAVLGMLRPVTLWPGLFFDGRSVVISLCGLFFGPWAAAVAGSITIAYRTWLGGPGTLTGVLVVCSSAAIGAFVHGRRHPDANPLSTGLLYAFGLLVHATMLVMLFAMPVGEAWAALLRIGPPVMLLYPFATVLAGKILSDQATHRAAERALRESEERLRLALAAAGQGLYDLDVQTGACVVSPEYARMLGYDPAEFRESNAAWRARLHPDDVGPVTQNLEEYLAGRCEEYRVEFRQRTKHGGWKWILSHGRVVARSADGRPLRMLGTHTDITERKEAALRLAESVERFQQAARATFNAIWDLDLTTGALWWNDNFYAIHRYRAADVEPTLAFWVASLHPDDRDRVEAGLAAAVESGQTTWSDEYRFRRGDGTYAVVEDRASIARDESGRAVRMLGAMQDVTGRRQADAELRLQSAALNAASNAIVITDREGTVVWVNPAFTTLTGYQPEEAIGRNPRLLKSGVHDQSLYTDLWETLLAGRVWSGELTNRRKDGSRYVEEQTITPVKDGSGDITHFIAIKRDLTKQHQLEAQFLQAQKMESVGRLAGGVAHDFNNLLTIINATAELVSRQLRDGDPLRADVQEIRSAGERAAVLTRQLLAFSRKQVVNAVVLDLHDVVVSLKGLLARLIGEDIDLVVRSSPGTCHVKADRGHIEQVLMNLAVNARDAMPTGGKLTVEIRRVDTVECDAGADPPAAPGPFVMLAVGDTGLGMDDAIRARIFEPFFTTKAPGEGTGLGLATVYGIVTQSGGRIAVQSAPGTGTTFRVYLPCLAAPAMASQPAVTRPVSRGAGTILLVEDEEGLRHLATRILRGAGYAVLPAATGEVALPMIQAHDGPVHLLLTDLVLPGMSGRELADRALEARPELEVLFMSGYTDDAVLRRGLASDDLQFIAKPYTIDDLTRKVRDVLQAAGPGHAGGTPADVAR